MMKYSTLVCDLDDLKRHGLVVLVRTRSMGERPSAAAYSSEIEKNGRESKSEDVSLASSRSCPISMNERRFMRLLISLSTRN